MLAAATQQWTGHRLPTAAERTKLAERIAAALSTGASRQGVLHALTRDLAPGQVRTTAVQVVMARTGQDGWAQQAPTVRAPQRPAHPPWCGQCDQHTRLLEDAEGRPRRCPACHALAVPAQAPAPAEESLDAPAQDQDADVAAEIARAKAALAALRASR